MKLVLRTALLIMIAVVSLLPRPVLGDSTTPPTREGFTPGSDPHLDPRLKNGVILGIPIRQAYSGLNADRSLHPRLSQGIN